MKTHKTTIKKIMGLCVFRKGESGGPTRT